MSRVYEKTEDGRVVNVRPRKRPRWTTRTPVVPGIYWFRFTDSSGKPYAPFGAKTRGCHLIEIIQKGGCCYTALYGFHFEVPTESDIVEWWPVRVKEPKQ